MGQVADEMVGRGGDRLPAKSDHWKKQEQSLNV